MTSNYIIEYVKKQCFFMTSKGETNSKNEGNSWLRKKSGPPPKNGVMGLL